jgi:hypothetical protein
MHELLTGLVERHRKALLARGGDPAQLDPAVLTPHFQEFIDAEREYQKAEDALLIATANKADAEQALSIELLQKAGGVGGAPGFRVGRHVARPAPPGLRSSCAGGLWLPVPTAKLTVSNSSETVRRGASGWRGWS